MSTLTVHRTIYDLEGDINTAEEFNGDYDAQLHANGCLIVVEYVPDLLSAEKGAKKAKLVSMYNKDNWDRATVDE